MESNALPEWIKNKIKEHYYEKYKRIAPEGFILVREEVLSELKDEIAWNEFKTSTDWIENRNKFYIKKEKGI